MTGAVIRSAGGEADVAFLARMLCWAADWEAAQLDESALERPEVARYVEGWGRPGDTAVVADKAGELVGAAWFRLFDANEPGYGFVDRRTPELTIGVEPSQASAHSAITRPRISGRAASCRVVLASELNVMLP